MGKILSRKKISTRLRALQQAFCAQQGWHPVCGADALLDDLGWHTIPLQRALGATTERD